MISSPAYPKNYFVRQC